MKVAIINHAFQKSFFRTRWEKFANAHKDVELFLITPGSYVWGKSSALTYGKKEIVQAGQIDEDNFHLLTVRSRDCITGGWKSSDLKKHLINIQPDYIYHIGTHTQNPLFQIIKIKNRYCRNSKLLSFSMRGTNTNKKSRISLMKYDMNPIKRILRIPMYLLDLNRLKRFNKNVDCVLCHYPEAKELFKNEGFGKKIYVQTQVGVDTTIFYPNEKSRQEIREKYNLGDSFVFGSASRFHYSKGIIEILEALNFDGDWKYLLIGSGTDKEIELIQNKINELNLSNKVILTGYIDTSLMNKYWNSIDCGIHFPKSTPFWVETFSLALTQMMATRKPVIGSSSGSVPFQVGPAGCVVKEGDSMALSSAMKKMMYNREFREANAAEMYKRANKQFSANSLNDQFYNLLKELGK